MYNFLVATNSGAWDAPGYDFPRNCFGEYSEPAIVERFKSLDAAAVQELKSFPTLFAYEGEIENLQIGYIRRIKDRGRTIYIEYEFEPRIPEIPFSKINELKRRLDIHDAGPDFGEFNRTHWAVKDEDLFEILFDAGLIDRKFLTSAGKVGRVEDWKFKVALSFSGEKRPYVSQVAAKLSRRLSSGTVFYDKDFPAQLARPNLDTILQKIYRDNSELVVVFISSEYEKKEWCGLEWRAVREIIMEKRDHSVMFIKFDDTRIDGLSKHDGYLDLNEYSLDDVVDFIVERVELNKHSFQKNASASDSIITKKNLTNAQANIDSLEEAKQPQSKSGEDMVAEPSDSSIALIKATPVLPSELERVQSTFKFYSPAQKYIKNASLPKVGEEWKLERTLPSGLNFLLNLDYSFKNEIKEFIQEKLLGIDIYSDFDERPYLYDVEKFEREDIRRGIQLWDTYSVAWHPTGRLLVTAGVGNIPRIWDVRTGESITKRVYWHTGSPAEMFCWSSDGELFLSGEDVFDGNTGEYLCNFARWTNYFRYSSHEYETLRGYHVGSGRNSHVSSTNNFSPWRPNSKQILFEGYEKNLILRNGRTGKTEKIIDCDISSKITDFAWHPKGRFLALTFDEYNIRIIDIDDAKIVDDLSVQNLVGWSPDGKILLARKERYKDDYVVWDALGTEEKPMPDEVKNELWFKQFSKNISADGLRYIKDARNESNIWSTNIYSVASDELVATLPKKTTSAAWSPVDGGLLAACEESETQIWRLCV